MTDTHRNKDISSIEKYIDIVRQTQKYIEIVTEIFIETDRMKWKEGKIENNIFLLHLSHTFRL